MRAYGTPRRRKGSRFYSVAVYENGRRTRRSTGTDSLKKAKAVVRQWIAEEETGPEAPRDAPPTVGVAVTAWLDSKRGRICASYMAVYASLSRQWVRRWRGRPVDSISTQEIDDYLRLRIARGQSPKTANGDRAALRSFYRWCQAMGYVARDPTALITKYPEPDRPIRTLTVDEEKRLLDAARIESDVAFMFISILLFSGLRRGTVAQLEWSDINWAQKTWDIPGEKMKSRKHFAGRPIETQLLSELETRRKRSGLIAGKLTATAWRSITRAAGLSDLKPHDLRRNFLTRCQRAGTPLAVTMWLSDHRDIKTVLAAYRGVDTDEASRWLATTWGRLPALSGHDDNRRE